MLFPNRVRAALQKTVPFSSPSGPLVGRIQYAPTAGYVRPFKKTVLFSSPSGPLVGRMRYAPTAGTGYPLKYRYDHPTGYVRFFEIPIRSPNRRGEGVWEVGRWGLPFAGETGVNEFGEEEDDDQNNDNKGA